MKTNADWFERIGAVFLPEADTAEMLDDDGAAAEPLAERPGPEAAPVPFPKLCRTILKTGCYSMLFVPTGASIFATRFRGTLRFEQHGPTTRMSGDLYRFRLFDDVVFPKDPGAIAPDELDRLGAAADVAADTGGAIPVYRRRSYNSYLKGTSAQLTTKVHPLVPCYFVLEFDQFFYTHPATGFSGSFAPTADRHVRFVMRSTVTPNLYTGDVFVGTTKIGAVSIRWISTFFRRASVQLNTLNGAVSPPASVGGNDFHTIFGNAGWDVTVTDAGAIALPASLVGVNPNACWSEANLHTLMESVPNYNAAGLDTDWRVHLVAVPARLVPPCSRGIMFDSSFGADPDAVPREGSATFSHDGYPAGEVPDGAGGSHYDLAADKQQKDVPRAYLRSATHEIGHAFNQIHQGFEAGNDNSIMTPTPSVATVLGTAGTFPDQINLAFNETVKRHLRHYPDPAVRPGGMDFFGSAVAAPEPADVTWVDVLDVTVTPSADRVKLGQPIELGWSLSNTGGAAVPVPARLDAETLLVRVSVTDPRGNVTFMRPAAVDACFQYELVYLQPGESISSSMPLFWGKDGFAFESSGRHRVEVIALWTVGGLHAAASGEAVVFVDSPVTDEENQVSALMFSPEVGLAVAIGDVSHYPSALQRIEAVTSVAGDHPAATFLRDRGLVSAGARPAPAKGAAKKSRGRSSPSGR